jgi:diguanylate cyclase (GGDEF)-like protein
MTDPSGRAEEQLAVLRQHFIAQLPARGREIERLVQALAADPDVAELWKRLIAAAHGLHGTAASYQLADIAAAAATIEALCDGARPRGAADRALACASALPALLRAIERFADAAAAPAPAPFPTPNPGAAERLIYILEDDSAFGASLAAQLGAYGYAARVFADRDTLLAALRAEAPRALIADMVLPDGVHAGAEIVQACRAVRSEPLAVIFVSARGDLSARIQAVRAGAEAYLLKPIDIGELLVALDRLTGVNAPAPFRILVVDDDPFAAEFHAAILQSAGMETAIVTNPLEVMARLIDFDADLMLLDMYMAQFTGVELAIAIRQHASFASLPIVYLSSERDVDKQLGAIAVGADDFLVKPVVPDRLISSVSARAQRLRLLRGLVTQDPMTKLLNHGAFADRLQIELTRAARTGASLAVGLIDIDFFKKVNDTYGHPTGDSVLKNLARLLKHRLRQGDIVARYGGEEFAVVLPDTELAAAKTLLDRLRESFAQTPQWSGTASFGVTLSCGIAAFPAIRQASDLVEAADRALYAAKHGGRNQVRLAEDAPAVSRADR